MGEMERPENTASPRAQRAGVGALLGAAVLALAGQHAPAGLEGCGNPGVNGALLALLPAGEETHVAVADGAWSNGAVWDAGSPPGPGAMVLIPAGVAVEYDLVSDAPLGVVRVDGELRFSTGADTRMVVETLMSGPNGVIVIGDADDPVAADVTAEVVFPDNGPLDQGVDVQLIGRGIVTLGPVRIYGAEKLDFVAIEGDALAGDQTLALDLPDGMTAPLGWRVGDRLVLGGTSYDPQGSDADNTRFRDEVLTVTAIEGSVVSFVNADTGLPELRFDHVRPSGQLYDASELTIHAANLTRNVSFRSAEGAATPTQQRGHAMFMHTPDVHVVNAGFYDLGRSDKNQLVDDPGQNVDGSPGFGANPRGRYGLHFHRNLVQGAQPLPSGCPPALAIGNVVWGSPGWGLVHHDAHCVFEHNVVFDVVGAGMVQEAGNEIGLWRNNIVIKTTGDDDPDADFDGSARVPVYDFGFNGEAYWIQGASQVVFEDNVAVSAAEAGVSIFSHVDGNQNRDRTVIPVEHLPPDKQEIVVAENGLIDISHTPINTFTGLEVYNSDLGIVTWHHMRNQSNWVGFTCPCDANIHRARSRIDGFTLWNIWGEGVFMQYTSQFDLVNGLVAAPPGQPPAVDLGINGDGRGGGISMNGPTKRLLVENVRIEGWALGLRTPREGQFSLADGDNSVEGADPVEPLGLPLRASEFRNVQMAGNSDNLFRRKNGFSPVAPFPNFLRIIDSTFEVPPGNQAPTAAFTAEAVGPLGVAHLDASASFDPDTPAPVANGDEGIAAFGWDLDADGVIDRFGREFNHAFEGAGPHEVSLTVWDHQGATASTTSSIAPAAQPYAELMLDPGFDAAEAQGPAWAFDGGRANEGWFGLSADIVGGAGRLTGMANGYTGFAQVVFDDHARRGEQRFMFDIMNVEGGPCGFFCQNEATVRVYSIDGEFTANMWDGTPSAAGAVPVEIVLLHEEVIGDGSSFGWTTRETTVDFGDGADYALVTVSGRGLVPGTGDDMRIDNVSIGPAPGSPADLDGDGAVTSADLNLLLGAFGTTDPAGDVDGDGDVDSGDLNLLLGDFGLGG